MRKFFSVIATCIFLLAACTHRNQTPDYSFPSSIDPARSYLFYLHGKIIEDQGIPAISSEFGEYQYYAILETLSNHDFIVVSEERGANTNATAYAQALSEQTNILLEAGVPAKNITIVGASKGSYIAIFTSHQMENEEINYVLLGSCHPDEVQFLIQEKILLHGNVLSIYDSADSFAGSCKDLFSISKENAPMTNNEILLEIGSGHGILYQPLDEWIIPTVEWAGKR